MRYEEAVRYIHGTLKFGSKLGLANIRELLRRLGDPHRSFHAIHVAGTNGKGSVTAMITNILHSSGYKVGMFTSPYLERFTERIQVNLREISPEALAGITDQVKEQVDQMVQDGCSHPTEFEIVTAIGFVYFASMDVDFAVVEVGLGGRLDSTNVVDPLLSIITSISYDHMDILGDTLTQIAFEKGGIIKEGKPVISYPQTDEAMDVLIELAGERHAPLVKVFPEQITFKEAALGRQVFDFHYRDHHMAGIEIHLSGSHQLLNAATALTAVKYLDQMGHSISDTAIYNGMAATRWPGRLEMLQKDPVILIDGAHNVSGAEALRDAVLQYLQDKKVLMIMGMLEDKDVLGVVQWLCPVADSVILTRPDSPRAMEPEKLAEVVRPYNEHIRICTDLRDAIAVGLNMVGEDGALVVTGSLYLIGRARTVLTAVINRQDTSYT